MKPFSKFLAATALSAVALTPVFALQQGQFSANDYTVKAYKDCEVVFEQAMTQVQLDAYLDLKRQEDKMRDVEVNLEGVEEELEQYTTEIAKLTQRTIQETDDTLFIDKRLLEQQEEVAERLEAFMEQHQHKYEALGEQGAIIGEYAEIFTDAIEVDLEHVDYDNIRIITPDKNDDNQGCYTRHSISVM